MRRALPVIILVLLLPIHILGLQAVTRERKALPKGGDASYLIPSQALKITSIEFDGLASDFMFLRALVFLGGTFERTERPRVKEWEWRWFYNTLSASTDLDPYFLDPYYVGQANLTWEGNLIRETNVLLEKGSRHREWDWMLPFFIGFNHFYFLQENGKASEYLMTASRRPGGSPAIASLAARLAYKGQRTENAIVFLEEMLKREEESFLKKEFETRLKTLRAILYLEQAAALYNERFGRPPYSPKDLVAQGLISRIPEDPYGGDFYIDIDGSVKTTSELRYTKRK